MSRPYGPTAATMLPSLAALGAPPLRPSSVPAADALMGLLALGDCRIADVSMKRRQDHGKVTVPAGQNVRMDVLYLEEAFKRCEIEYPFDYHVIDLATLYYSWSLVAGEVNTSLSLRQAATTAGLVEGQVPRMNAYLLGDGTGYILI